MAGIFRRAWENFYSPCHRPALIRIKDFEKIPKGLIFVKEIGPRLNEPVSMHNTMNIPESKILDVRQIPCADKHRQIFERWNAMEPGDFFVLWNRRDPLPLLRYFETALAGCFTWDYLQNEQDSCRIKISKLQVTPAVTEYPTCQGH